MTARRSLIDRVLMPLPRQVEDTVLRYAWIVVGINVIGTGFGFWYYRFQFSETPLVIWPWIPDSPLATLFMALSLALWKLGRTNELVNVLAFYGNIKLGLWTPFTLLAFRPDFAYLHPAMFHFLFWSHLLMVAQAFLIHRYSRFPPWAICLALTWYTVDLILDYFVPVVGGPHHTWIPVSGATELWLNTTAFQLIAGAATVLTIWITVLAFLSHVRTKNS